MINSSKKNKIVILGYGWVGQANALALARMGYEVFYYDVVEPKKHYPEYAEIYNKILPINSPLEQDGSDTWYLVCVGDKVLEDGKQDISLISKVLEFLKPAKGKVVLRSTVLPQLLKNLEFDLYLPEFLHEIKAVEECLNPFYFVIGTWAPIKRYPSFLNEWRARANKVFEGTPEEASYIKYLSNIWNATRVAFVNEIGDIMFSSLGDIKNAEKVLDFVLEKKAYFRYGRSFGGHCLPKDIRAFTHNHLDRNVSLLKATWESNIIHQKVETQQTSLQSWFSFWDYNPHDATVPRLLPLIWKRLNATRTVRSVRSQLKPIARHLVHERSLSETKKMWNKMALKNARYFANVNTPSHEHVDEFELEETGKKDYEKYVAGDELLHQKLGNSRDKVMLEIGSGIGRMTKVFVNNFKEVYAIDISDVMISNAKKWLSGLNNITLTVNDGATIPFEDNMFDFVFSTQTFRYIPREEIFQKYFSEICRTLKHGGIAKIELRCGPNVARKWEWSYGIALNQDSSIAIARNANLTVLKYQPERRANAWLWLEK